MDPRTNKGNAYKARRTRTESGREKDGTTGKGSDSVGKDRKRVPAGVPLTVLEFSLTLIHVRSLEDISLFLCAGVPFTMVWPDDAIGDGLLAFRTFRTI